MVTVYIHALLHITHLYVKHIYFPVRCLNVFHMVRDISNQIFHFNHFIKNDG